MAEPIPDEVLRRAVQAMAAGDKIRLLTEAGHEAIMVKQVFAELLALREAARDADSKCVNKYDCGGCAPCVDAWARIRALLPEEPK